MRTQRTPLGGGEIEVHFLEEPSDLDYLRDWLRQHRGPIAADTETTGLAIWRPDFKIRTFQLGDADTGWVIPVERFGTDAVRKMLAYHRYDWVFHNAPYDLLALERTGYGDARDIHSRTWDTKQLWHLIDPRNPADGGLGLGLKPISRRYIDRQAPDTQNGLYKEFAKIKVPTGEFTKAGKPKFRKATKDNGWALIDLENETYWLYAGLDVIFTHRLYTLGRKLVERQGSLELYRWEHRIQSVGLEIERKGALVDVDWTEALAADWERQIAEHDKAAAELGVKNVNAPKQVVDGLQAKGAALTKLTDSGNLSADKDVLKELIAAGGEVSQLAYHIQQSKRMSKRRKSYAVAMLDRRDENDRVHPVYNTLQARTARQSMSAPPFQQLPSKEGDWHIRRCVIAKPGHVLVSTDMDQVEYRIAGAIANEPEIIAAAKAGKSIHKATAELLFGPGYSEDQYKLAKNTGFCKLFGGGVEKVAETSGAPLDQAKDVVDRFNNEYHQMRVYGWELQAQVREDAGVDAKAYKESWNLSKEEGAALRKELTDGKLAHIQTPRGRWLPVEAWRAYAAVNYMIQSTARDILCDALLEIERRGLLQYVILVVHDEIIAEVPEDRAEELAREFSDAMSTVFMGVPLTATYEPKNVCGHSWGEKYMTDDDKAAWLSDDDESEDE